MSEKLRVMVVDDDRDLRDSLCEVLEDEGYDAVCAANGAEALLLLRGKGQQPNIIILDLMMPVMDGWAFRETQLADPMLTAIPVVVMSASQSPGAITANEVLSKPIRLDSLLTSIERHGRRDS